MAIKASDLMKPAEGDPAALQQSHAPDVRIGGDLVAGNDLAVPAGQTWRVNGNVKIEDGAVIRIEDGATLALTGIAAHRVGPLRMVVSLACACWWVARLIMARGSEA